MSSMRTNKMHTHGRDLERHSNRILFQQSKRSPGGRSGGDAAAGRKTVQPPENAAKEAENPARILSGESQPTQHYAQIVAIGGLHRMRRVGGGAHDLFDDTGQKIEAGGGGSGIAGGRLLPRGLRLRGAGGKLIQTDGDGLAQIHRGLAGIGGNLNQDVAMGEILAGESVFFRAEDEGYASTAAQLLGDERSQRGKRNDRLLWLTVCEGSSACDQSTAGDGLGQIRRFHGIQEQLWRSHCRAGLAPCGRKGRDDVEMRKAEVGHRAGGRSDVEGIAWRDQHHVKPVAL